MSHDYFVSALFSRLFKAAVYTPAIAYTAALPSFSFFIDPEI
jgi:hypothetical protein